MELFMITVYGWALLTAIITKTAVVDLAWCPRDTSFTNNSKTLKRESIAMPGKFLEFQLLNIFTSN